MAYATLIAIMDSTTLNYMSEELEIELQIPIYSAILFCGNTKHSGSEYSNYNMRIHCYLDSDDILHNIYSQDRNVTVNYDINYQQVKQNNIIYPCIKDK